MRHEYHYIVSGLPDLKPDDRKVDLTLGELKMQLDDQVSIFFFFQKTIKTS